MPKANDDLEFPRLVYRGDPDEKDQPSEPDTYEDAETKTVHNQDELDEAEKDGWRLTRFPDAQSAKKAARSKAGREDQFDPQTATVADLKAHIATVDDAAELDRLQKAEEAHPDHADGRVSALKAIEDRRAELNG